MAEQKSRKSEINLVKILISIAVGVVVAILPPLGGLTPEIMRFLGVFIFMIIALVTNAAPQWLVTTTSCMLMVLLKLAKINEMLGNFASNNIWLPLAIIGFAGCLAKSGLLSRIAFKVFRIFPTTFRGQSLATAVTSLVLLPLVPSTSAKLGVMGPFTESLAKEAGIKPHTRAMKGLWYIMFTVSYLCSFTMLTGSNGNFLILGFAPEDQAAMFTWGYWFKVCIVWLLVMLVLTVAYVCIFMKPEEEIVLSKDIVEKKLAELGPMSGDEKYCLAVLACAVALWITESYHGISTVLVAWAALIAMIVRGLFTSKDVSGLPWQFFMFLAGLLGMADYMGACGVSDWMSASFEPIVSRIIPNQFVFVLVLIVVVWVVRLFIDSLSAMAVIPTIFGPMAALYGISPFLVVWITFTVGQIWILPHNTPSMQTAVILMNEAVDHKDVRNLSFVYMLFALIATLASIPLWKGLGLM